jgi:predicted nucleic acid-binding protein
VVAARGNTVPDTYLAALVIKHGAQWNSTDRDFTRSPSLRCHHPLDTATAA